VLIENALNDKDRQDDRKGKRDQRIRPPKEPAGRKQYNAYSNRREEHVELPDDERRRNGSD
jgi:hypothetical protein